MKHSRFRPQSGFTLIEIMIACAVLAVVAAIALPAYKGYIATSRQTEGWNNLNSLAIAQEEFFLENNTYFEGTDADTLSKNSGGLWTPSEPTEAERNFAYTVAAGTTGAIGSSFLAKATGKGTKVPVTTVLEKAGSN